VRPLALLGLGLWLGACQGAGPGAAGTDGVTPVVVSRQPITRTEEEAAQALYQTAQASFQARRYFEVLRTTSDLLERYPSSSVSGDALLLTLRAQVEVGEDAAADSVAERYLALLPPGHPRASEVRLLQARGWRESPATALDRLLRIEALTTPEQRIEAEEATRAAAEALERDELAAVLETAPADGPLAPIPQAYQAVYLLERGQDDEARALAQAVLERGVEGQELAFAESVARGELPPERRPVRSFRIAAVLPTGGSPTLSGFARQLAEGIELAAATVLEEPFEVSLIELDDQGDPDVGAQIVSTLDSTGVAGVVGFLEEGQLVAAAQARQRGIPIISPTARSTEGAGEGVYSLEGPDPRAATEIARYAASRAFQRVAILLPGSPHAYQEASAFQQEAERLGIPIVGTFTYEPGATFFETQILGAQNVLRAAEIAALRLGPEDTLRVEMLEPVGIFLPVPPEDIEYLGPQIAHFALDTLAIELVGTSGWTDSRVLELVQPRYTDGVVATATTGSTLGLPGLQRFRDAYEQYFQRTLTTTTPAFGYDATLLLLEALRPGRISPSELRVAIGGLEGVEGATGTFSVVNDRIVRETQVVRIQNRELVPLGDF